MKRAKKHSIMQKLTSKNLIFVVGMNVLLPFLAFIFINRLIAFQVDRGLLRSVPENYHSKLTLLVLLLVMIILAVVDYFYMIQPFQHLEEVIKEYGKITNMKLDAPYDNRFVKSSLEQQFLAMLSAQKEINEEAQKRENQIQTTELYALQTQINPHFLYNTLDSIRGLALVNGVEEIASMTEALSRLFRSMIAKEGQMLLLSQELENVKNYMLIQDFRFNNRFTYECRIPDNLLERYVVPNMTLQPLVENAIMHGLEKKFGKGRITVSGYATEKRLILSVTDNGVGIEEDKLHYLNERLMNYRMPIQPGTTRFHVGIALLNINKRMKLKFGDEYGIYLASTPNISTTTELVLPAILAEEKELDLW